MVADVTESRNVILSLEPKTCMAIKSYLFIYFTKFQQNYKV